MRDYELNEIIACAKALKKIECDLPLRRTLARAMKTRLKGVWRWCGLEWHEKETRTVRVALPDCHGVEVEIFVQQRYTIDEAKMLANVLLTAANDASVGATPKPTDADCDTE